MVELNVPMLKDRHPHPVLYFITEPLIGTVYYKPFLGLLADMNVDITRCRFFNHKDNPFAGFSGTSLSNAIKFGHIKVIAIGDEPYSYLLSTKIDSFFKLQKSGVNSQQCEGFIYGKDILKAEGEGETAPKSSLKEQSEVFPPEG